MFGYRLRNPTKMNTLIVTKNQRHTHESATEIVKVTNKKSNKSYTIIAGNFYKCNWYLMELYN